MEEIDRLRAELREALRKLESISKHPDVPLLIKQYAAGKLDQPAAYEPLTGDGFSEGEDAERRGEVPIMRGDEHG